MLDVDTQNSDICLSMNLFRHRAWHRRTKRDRAECWPCATDCWAALMLEREDRFELRRDGR